MKKRGKKNINSHLITMAVLGFVLTLIVGEVVIFVVFEVFGEEVDAYRIMLYVIPAFSAILTAVLIYINHRTLGITNKLIEGLNKIAEGNYGVTIPYKKLDSFTAVYENFNKMSSELNSVKTLREDFVHDLSHEFKTPIASINGFANLLLDSELSEEDRTKILRIIADESARLSRLSESTLLLSKLEKQQFIGEKKNYRLDLQIKDCVIMLERQWAAKDITINSELPPVTYAGEAYMVEQVWINLLSNAVKFTPRGGEIGVRLFVEGGLPVVEISDNGIGIAEEDLPKIFDKYFQSSHDKDGNGLGLAVCKRVIGLCGGSISVQSKRGEGTRFTVKL